MKVLIWGNEERYQRDMPDYVAGSGLEPVFCPRQVELTTMFPEHANAELLFVDAISPVDGALMDRMPNLKMVHSEGVAYNAIDLQAARERGTDLR